MKRFLGPILLEHNHFTNENWVDPQAKPALILLVLLSRVTELNVSRMNLRTWLYSRTSVILPYYIHFVFSSTNGFLDKAGKC